MFILQRSMVLVLALSMAALLEPDRAGDEAAIRAQVAAYESGVNQRDAAAVADLYTTDGDLIRDDGPRLVGREAIRRSIETTLSASSPTMRININVTNIRFLNPDIAIVETVATFNEGDVRENRGTSVMVRESGKWLTAALRVFAAEKS